MVRKTIVRIAFLIAFLGCADKDPHGRESLTGTVTFQGRPLGAGTIEFLPPDPRQGLSARGQILNGRFVIPRSLGVPAGTYRVLISSPKPNPAAGTVGPPGMKMPPPGEERIPPAYNRDSRVTVEVRPGEANHFDFAID
jgi:hypothetical protein